VKCCKIKFHVSFSVLLNRWR